MNDRPRPSIADLLADHELITAAINRGVREAVLKHAQAGKPIAAMEGGKVVWVRPEEILADLSEESQRGRTRSG